MVMKLLKKQLLSGHDMISIKHVNELIKGLNKKQEIEEENKKNTWLIVALVALGVIIAGVVVYKVFFAGDDFDEFDEFDDEFEDMDFEDDYEDFDELDEDFENEIDDMIDTVSDEE